ncbi:cytidylate kinase family protein [Brucepastera parasyntrophica]|uniref:cytidylate kinase family protein n=1 Tax=Brucepastera parasyntrophica TaxID=2880008 RepID=UPI00210A0887|nr:cytidylate kinase family protein [Brucepastera parasyntrophica]ULQ59359.1 cytidylate kinase family protein [Brucepastera parasyntrophica]
MAIITISRQIAALGDETASELARQMGYTFINRKMIEADLLKFGITEEKLRKYDERKPGFWASLARDRDEYFDYLRETIYERVKDGNCVCIGRGSYAILSDIPGCYSVRLVAPDPVRLSRLMKEFSWTEKQAMALMQESDQNRMGYHKCFFNIDNDDPSIYDMVLNTASITAEQAAKIVANACENSIDPKASSVGLKLIADRLVAQRIVNHLAFDLKLPIHFLEATTADEEIVLHGVADSPAVIEKAVSIAQSMAAGKKITSGISIVQEYKTYL